MREAFIRWQCRARQLAMRESGGKPDGSAIASARLLPETESFAEIITVLPRSPDFSVVPEMKHMFQRTNDPAERRENALRFFAAGYYQNARKFTGALTATFGPGSKVSRRLLAVGRCALSFEAFAQRFDLACAVRSLPIGDALREATVWHNLLFNPGLRPNSDILVFEPDWASCRANPPPPRNVAS
ncbi:MAG: hypothetical protein OXI87_13560 [Albidovulum sp.]|nr:hypothetical protein [Albidovulum sp.]MDE0530582.1 hypothetical protein [Albidovulum sp.]